MDSLLTKEEKGSWWYGYMGAIFNFVLQKPHENNTKKGLQHHPIGVAKRVFFPILSYPFSHL